MTKTSQKNVFLMKLAGELERNKGSVQAGEELHKDPEGYATPKTKKELEHFSDGTWEMFLDDNPRLVGNAFGQYRSAAAEAKDIIAQNFNTKDYETRQPLLRKYASDGLIASPDTLREKLEKL